MTLDRPLSEWQADLAAYEKQADRILCLLQDAKTKGIYTGRRKRVTRKRIERINLCREYVELRSRVRLCESAISEAMLNHRP